MDDRYTFKKIDKADSNGHCIGCFIDNKKYYFNNGNRAWLELSLDENNKTRWCLTSSINENGIVHVEKWNKSFFDLFEKHNVKKVFIELELSLDENNKTRWCLTSSINENGIVHVEKWNKSFFDLFEKHNVKKVFIEKDDEIIQMLIPNPHKLKLGVKEWMLK